MQCWISLAVVVCGLGLAAAQPAPGSCEGNCYAPFNGVTTECQCNTVCQEFTLQGALSGCW